MPLHKLSAFQAFFSRSLWAMRLLKLSRLKEPASERGLVMLQIDGLSRMQLERALAKGRMPFLNSLIKERNYKMHSFYSGLPSNTPAVQAEIFYGVKTCVPAFSFMDRHMGRTVKMMELSYAAQVEERLKAQGDGLLAGGSSYSNIYTGGAKEAHFCFSQMGWSGMLNAINPLKLPFFLILYIDILLRMIILLVAEFFLALYECIRGTLKGRMFLKELEFVWLRVLVCIFLREICVAGVRIDIMRGHPVIHFNLLGYDEQSHCRGPSSRFAHWSLQGIDDAIERIYKTMSKSPYREYDLWVYSDHGQEKTVPYETHAGRTLEAAVKDLFSGTGTVKVKNTSIAHERGKLLKDKLFRRTAAHVPELLEPGDVVLAAMGPVGHIYVNKHLERHETDYFAKRLVEDLKIPLVLTEEENGKYTAWTPRGRFIVPDQVDEVFGSDHPFLEEVREDIMRICNHPDAGDFIIAGWSKDQTCISFPFESGAHAGVGTQETHAFALLPSDAPIDTGKGYIRPMDLREAASRVLNPVAPFEFSLPRSGIVAPQVLRVMSYNVHGCLGLDGDISTDRISRVINRYRPDVVCLQELDVGRERSARIHQVEKIAEKLGMSFHFYPAFKHKEGEYGSAILSRDPATLIKKSAFPQLPNTEPRGAVWVSIDHGGTKINIINTHLSLWPLERVLQVNELLSDGWLGSEECQGPTVLCGDFNMTPGSYVYKKLCGRVNDSQSMLASHKPYHTWFACYPFRRIDYVFISSDLQVKTIRVPQTAVDRLASDHLPLIVDLYIEDQKQQTFKMTGGGQ